MKEKLLIVGAGGFGRVVLEHAQKDYDCSFVDDGYDYGHSICGASVVGHMSDLESLAKEYHKLIVAIGNNSVREHVYKKAIELGFDFPNIVCDSVYISPYAEVGYGCVFLNHVVVQNSSHVGNGVILNPGVEIHHDSFVDDYSLIYTNSCIRTYARVGKKVKIGSNVTVSNDVVLEDNTIVENGHTVLL